MGRPRSLVTQRLGGDSPAPPGTVVGAMAVVEPARGYAPTHEVLNRAPPLVGYNAFEEDRPLVEAFEREGAGWARDRAREIGEFAGGEAIELGRQANENPPILRTHDRYGNRVDEVEFHPSWHRLLGKGVAAGLTAAWSRPGGHVRPAAASLVYDRGLRPASEKAGVIFGMGMTEKQGGSDVRANTTVARPLAEDGTYELTGHKWFCSAPMSDGFLVLAQAPEGLTCFLVPRVLEDGARNTFLMQRLKDKLGNRSNASSEVEFDGTWARRVGDEGRGVRTIIEMVAATRVDCVLGSAAIMRQAVAQAVHHCTHREAFGAKLVDKPLMRNVLADLALESEAATTLALRLAAAYDDGSEQERAFLRLAVPAAKYWVTKRCAPVAVEAAECLGGNGYVEESGLPRLVRESPLNSIWEGAGNVQALDVLRALQREPQALNAYLQEVGKARGADHRLDGAIKDLLTELAGLDGIEGRARRLTERLALVLQGSLLVRYAPPEVADAFCASRLGGDGGAAFGTLPHTLDLASVVERARPVS